MKHYIATLALFGYSQAISLDSQANQGLETGLENETSTSVFTTPTDLEGGSPFSKDLQEQGNKEIEAQDAEGIYYSRGNQGKSYNNGKSQNNGKSYNNGKSSCNKSSNCSNKNNGCNGGGRSNSKGYKNNCDQCNSCGYDQCNSCGGGQCNSGGCGQCKSCGGGQCNSGGCGQCNSGGCGQCNSGCGSGGCNSCGSSCGSFGSGFGSCNFDHQGCFNQPFSSGFDQCWGGFGNLCGWGGFGNSGCGGCGNSGCGGCGNSGCGGCGNSGCGCGGCGNSGCGDCGCGNSGCGCDCDDDGCEPDITYFGDIDLVYDQKIRVEKKVYLPGLLRYTLVNNDKYKDCKMNVYWGDVLVLDGSDTFVQENDEYSCDAGLGVSGSFCKPWNVKEKCYSEECHGEYCHWCRTTERGDWMDTQTYSNCDLDKKEYLYFEMLVEGNDKCSVEDITFLNPVGTIDDCDCCQ